jgi:hypothetical protein
MTRTDPSIQSYVPKKKKRLFPSHITFYYNRNRRYELVIKEQPQQCQASGFGENDMLLPMNPTPIVQLLTYEDNQLIEPE